MRTTTNLIRVLLLVIGLMVPTAAIVHAQQTTDTPAASDSTVVAETPAAAAPTPKLDIPCDGAKHTYTTVEPVLRHPAAQPDRVP